MLRNLISNSIKYTKPGGTITIKSSYNTQEIIISVVDDGVGMSENIKNSLFKSNVNTSTYGTAYEKGTGLGLIICRDFIEELGGKIWVESEIDRGSTFTFTIPNK